MTDSKIVFDLTTVSGDELLKQLCYRIDEHWYENTLLERTASAKISAEIKALNEAAAKLTEDGFDELAEKLKLLAAELEAMLNA